MNKNILIALPLLFLFAACSKEKSKPEAPPGKLIYLNKTVGSSWKYHEVNASGATAKQSDYTLISSGSDTTVNGKTYHIYNMSYGLNRYLNVQGNEYFEYDTVPGGGTDKIFDRLYLKTEAPGGTNWSQDVTLSVQGIQIPVKVSNTIDEIGLKKTVNGTTYDNVIHVSTKITSALIPAASLITNIHSYYAPGYGLVENTTKLNLDYLGMIEKVDNSTTLTSAVLK